MQPEAPTLVGPHHHVGGGPALHPARQAGRRGGIGEVDIDRNVGGETQVRIRYRAIVIITRTDQLALFEEGRQVHQLVLAIDVDLLAIAGRT